MRRVGEVVLVRGSQLQIRITHQDGNSLVAKAVGVAFWTVGDWVNCDVHRDQMTAELIASDVRRRSETEART